MNLFCFSKRYSLVLRTQTQLRVKTIIALGQVMLYVDGMNGIIAHNATIQWLYELLDSPFRLVVKTALKLLLVFIEYNDNNALYVLAAISAVDRSKGMLRVLKVLKCW
ncbi:hypothetical protein DICVIV_02539 [Dictyocaulus viviparus]|uniref:FHOD1/3-like FH3 domain-containing protein n=1 Tax=Dictyocaulus viviparus TaxID=29172 RepID=A0A0D8Y3I5_DICVI|nr:hypothetical protein DICVIV_02539 [Dictyocaulus viviparus]